MKAAGYSGAHASSRAAQELAKPHVRAYLLSLANETFDTKLLAKALKTIDTLVGAADSDATRLRAAELVLGRSSLRPPEPEETRMPGSVVINLNYGSDLDGTHRNEGEGEGGFKNRTDPSNPTPQPHTRIIESTDYREVD